MLSSLYLTVRHSLEKGNRCFKPVNALLGHASVRAARASRNEGLTRFGPLGAAEAWETRRLAAVGRAGSKWNLSLVICASWDGGLREGGDGLWSSIVVAYRYPSLS